MNTIEEAIEDFREGKFVIVVDDEDRENEGDFIIAAEKITPEKVNFMLRHGRGVLCAPLTEERCAELELTHQVQNNTSMLGTPFTITVDKLEGCTTGVSAHDRAATIRALADPASTPATFGRPGHINPLYAKSRGVLRRAGHTEAAIDLARLAGLYPAAALAARNARAVHHGAQIVQRAALLAVIAVNAAVKLNHIFASRRLVKPVDILRHNRR